MDRSFDLIVIGAGIVGLAHALSGVRRGLRVGVFDRDARANGASVRNFGLVAVTGQRSADTWRRAHRTREVWNEIAPLAGIRILQRGLLMAVRRPEALAVIEEFAAGSMGEGCRVLRHSQLPEPLRARPLLAALHSPHELRVDSRQALPRLAAWLASAHGVRFHWGTAVRDVAAGGIETARGAFTAPWIVVCPGTDLSTLFPTSFERRSVGLCKLHMLRLADPGWRLPAAVMSDLGLDRYAGYASCPSLPSLRERLRLEQRAELDNGVHLIVTQDEDGSLVVGDSHHHGSVADPFQPRYVDALILREAQSVLDLPRPEVLERWVGHYPYGPQDAFVEAPLQGVRLVSVTSGTGASTAFGLAQEVIDALAGPEP